MMNRGRWLVVGVVVAAVVLIAGCGSKWLAGGKLHFDQGRYERALETFQNAVAEQPDNGEAHLWLGRALAELERDDEAKAEIMKADELAPELNDMVSNTLQSYWSRRFNSGLTLAVEAQSDTVADPQARLEQAVDRFKRAAIYAPDSAQNYTNLGKVLFQLGRTDEALSVFDQARVLSEDRRDQQELLWKVYLTVGQMALENKSVEGYQRAIDMFNKAATFDRTPAELADVNFNIGVAYMELSAVTEGEASKENLKSSESHFLKALEVNPNDEAALQNLAYVYSDLGDNEKAVAMGQRLLDLEPWKPQCYATMTRLYNAANDRDKSAGYYIVSQVLMNTKPAGGTGARAEASGGPPRNDMLMTLLDRAVPQMVYDYQSTRGLYKVWAYWTDGRIYIFKDYKEVFRIAFKGMTQAQVKQELTQPEQ